MGVGRVLSEDEIQAYAGSAYAGHYLFYKPFSTETENGGQDILDLIATIRDRDKTIAELQDKVYAKEVAVQRWHTETGRLQEQNTILREALEEIAGYQIGEKGTCDINLYYCVTDAREALAKVKGE